MTLSPLWRFDPQAGIGNSIILIRYNLQELISLQHIFHSQLQAGFVSSHNNTTEMQKLKSSSSPSSNFKLSLDNAIFTDIDPISPKCKTRPIASGLRLIENRL